MLRFVWTMYCFLFFSFVATGATINVPDDYTTIQAAINAASNGDLILVEDGVYYEDSITFGGKAVTVKSENGYEDCVVWSTSTYYNPEPVFRFVDDEENDSVLDGLTIRGGRGEYVADCPG